MKKNGVVFNRKMLKWGRQIAQWAVRGLNFQDKETYRSLGQEILNDPKLAERLGRVLKGITTVTQTEAAMLLQATVGRMDPEWFNDYVTETEEKNFSRWEFNHRNMVADAVWVLQPSVVH